MKILTLTVLALTLPNLATAQPYSAPEDLKLIGEIFARALEIEQVSKMSGVERMVYRVDGYNMEINSGVDFIQWLSGTSPEEVSGLPKHLETIGANDSSRICEEAIKVAFPKGVPTKRSEYSATVDAYVLDPSKRPARDRLAELARLQVEQNLDLTAKLASWIRNQSKAAQPGATDNPGDA